MPAPVAARPMAEPAAAEAQALPMIRLQPGGGRRALAGYPWLFANEIVMDETARGVPPGALVRVAAEGGRPLGLAGFNRHALIAGRILSRAPDARIDAEFLAARLARARALRDRLYDRPFYRLVHAEADGLPGLVIDRYGEVLVAQLNTATMDRLRPALLAALDTVLAPRAVVLRNDSPARGLEGLDSRIETARGALDGPVELEENGARFLADPLGGQKTGWFFDQRDNRAFAARLAGGATVLDVYTHTGGFAIQAALAGAARVTAVDSSAPALDLAARSADLNSVAGRIEWRRAEAFAEFERLGSAPERFGLVIADPPAFVKSKKDLQAGARGYRKLARLAARVVAPGGFLLLASCSHHVDPALFAEQVARGLTDARRTGRILRHAGPAPDHPTHPLLPESAYLKALVLQLD